MKLKKAISIVEKYQLWRRDTEDKGYEMPNPTELGIAIDVILNVFKDISNGCLMIKS